VEPFGRDDPGADLDARGYVPWWQERRQRPVRHHALNHAGDHNVDDHNDDPADHEHDAVDEHVDIHHVDVDVDIHIHIDVDHAAATDHDSLSFAADALFEPGAAFLTDQAILDIGSVISGIDEVRSVRVEGHTDHRGSDTQNLALSQARADAAAAALIDAGIDGSVITAVELGEAQAHLDNPTDDEMAGDRRVDVVIDADVPITTTC